VRRSLFVAVALLALLAPLAALVACARPAAADANAAKGFGSAASSTGQAPRGSAPVVGMAAAPEGTGFWLVAADGGVFAFGSASFHGSLGSTPLNQPIVGMAATADGRGYWLVASDGGVFAFGSARFHGSLGSLRLNQPVVGMAATPSGYWLVAADGGVFAFGSASFHGSLGSTPLNQPIVGMAAAPTGPPSQGYWLVAADGGVFAFGRAPFHGSLGSLELNQPVVGMAATKDGGGYWLAAADGGVFSLGNAPFHGSDAGSGSPHSAVAIAGASGGYWIASGRSALGPQVAAFVAGRAGSVTAAVFDIITGQTSTFRPEVVTHTASTVKVDILATLLTQAQAGGRALTDRERSLAAPMIQSSSDSAANALWVQVGAGNIARFQQAAGTTQTVPPANGKWGKTTTTALDRIAVLRHLVFPSPLLIDASRAYVLDLMEHVTPSQAWGITGGVPPTAAVALKNGFSQINGWQINSYGWVRGEGRNYLIAVLTDGNPTDAYGIDTINRISAIVWNALAP
jgi:beta-lactamase class A